MAEVEISCSEALLSMECNKLEFWKRSPASKQSLLDILRFWIFVTFTKLLSSIQTYTYIYRSLIDQVSSATST